MIEVRRTVVLFGREEFINDLWAWRRMPEHPSMQSEQFRDVRPECRPYQ